jgi:hypothetical protein
MVSASPSSGAEDNDTPAEPGPSPHGHSAPIVIRFTSVASWLLPVPRFSCKTSVLPRAMRPGQANRHVRERSRTRIDK